MLTRWEDAVARKCKLNFYLKSSYMSIMPSKYGFLTVIQCSYLDIKHLKTALEILDNE